MGRAPVVSLVVSLVALAGCDTVFSLHRADGGADAASGADAPAPVNPMIVTPDGDADGDGDTNLMDLCPLIEKTEPAGNLDTDHDGVGDLCDPNPTDPGDCLVLFDKFGSDGALDPRWQNGGATPTLEGDHLKLGAGAETMLFVADMPGVSSLSVDGYIFIGTSTPRVVQLLFDLRRTPFATGTACSVEDKGTGTGSFVAVQHLDDGTATAGDSAPLDDTPIDAGTNLDLGWNDHAFVGRCHAQLATEAPSRVDTSVPLVPPASSTVAIRLVNTGVNVRSIVGYSRNCP